MFADAIEEVGGFTRPIHYITKTYDSDRIIAESSTIFFVNDKGAAITARHVAEDLMMRQNIEKNYRDFKQKVSAIQDGKGGKAALRQLEREEGYELGVATHAKTRFVECFERITSLTIHTHPVYDLAIIQFHWEGKKLYHGHAVFAEDRSYTKPGDFLCRLGFPFSEFDDFAYNAETDELDWVPGGTIASPRFPIDGMVTRFLGDANGAYGIEMSTPGFMGQSGAPLFDEDAIVCGMQFATSHLYLGFDVEDYHVIEHGRDKRVNNQPFLHVGHCIDAEVIKSFLAEHRIEHYIDQ